MLTRLAVRKSDVTLHQLDARECGAPIVGGIRVQARARVEPEERLVLPFHLVRLDRGTLTGKSGHVFQGQQGVPLVVEDSEE